MGRISSIQGVRKKVPREYQMGNVNGHGGEVGQIILYQSALVAGAWTEREKMFHGGSFLKLADDDM